MPPNNLRRAVFLDRDGVLNQPVVREGLPYPPHSVEEFILYPEVVAACTQLRNAGFLLVVATNQPDIGRGTQSLAVVEAMHEVLRAQILFDRIEVCTAGSSDAPGGYRRKPAPGMLLDAAAALHIDLTASFMVGDRWRDIDCGHAAGCRTIFLERGYVEKLKQAPDFIAHDLTEAARIILQEEGLSGTMK